MTIGFFPRILLGMAIGFLFAFAITFKTVWLLVAGAVAVFAVLRILFENKPNIVTASLFFIPIIMLFLPVAFSKLDHYCFFLGALSNYSAIVANNGKMPVYLPPYCTDMGDFGSDDKHHVLMTNGTRLKGLCDIYYGASIGDMLIVISVITGFFI